MAPAPAPAPAPINLADVAGKWNMHAVPTSGDTTSTNFVLTATGTTSGWSLKYPGRAAVPETITVSGDSIITSAGPYPSFRRKGVTVTTNGVFRLQNGSLVNCDLQPDISDEYLNMVHGVSAFHDMQANIGPVAPWLPSQV